MTDLNTNAYDIYKQKHDRIWYKYNYSDLVISLGQSSGDSPGKESGCVCIEYG